MSDKNIPLKYNPRNYTIELSEAKKVLENPTVGNYLILGKVYSPDRDQWVDARLLIVPDGGFSN